MHFSSGIGIYWSLEEYFVREKKKIPKPLTISVSNIKITGSLEELSHCELRLNASQYFPGDSAVRDLTLHY